MRAEEPQKDDLEADDLVASAIYNIRSVDKLRFHHRFNCPPDLGTGLLEVLGFDSSDPRDKIYAVENICRTLGKDGLQPDYKALVSYVYNRTAYDLLTKHHILHILLAAGVGHVRKNENLASWAPDWRHGKLLIGGHIIDSYHFAASGSQTLHIQGDWCSKSLTFVGIQIDAYGRQFPFPQPRISPPGRITRMIEPSARPWINEIRIF